MLYVAATRARDHLLIPCVVGRANAGHLLGELVGALPEDDATDHGPRRRCDRSPNAHNRGRTSRQQEQLAAAVKERAEWAESRAELMTRAAREREIETASSRERAQGPLAAEVATFASALVLGEGPPIPVGDAVHMVMERISLPDAEDLEAIAEDVCLEGDIAEQLEDVIAMCRACLQADCVQRALAGERYWREVPFLLSRTDNRRDADTGPLATGRVDLVHQDGDELIVIDYKTDKDVTADAAEAHALEKHSGQAEIYSQALAAATALPVREVVFVYCKAGVEVRLSDGAVVR